MSIADKAKRISQKGIRLYKKNRIKAKYRKELKKSAPLSRKQKEEIQLYWNKYGFNIPTLWHEALYVRTGVQTPRFLPESTFMLEILPYLRNDSFVNGWGDKSYLDYFIKDAETVQCVLRNVSGRYLDHNFNLISYEEAQDILNHSEDSLVIKPTTNTNTGKGVMLLRKPYDLKNLAKKYKKNFVFQIPIRQHAAMACFNASSVNTIRINSVLFETEVDIMSAFVKVGQTGEFADNHGKNRFFVGLKDNGVFCDYAIDHDLNKYESIPSDYIFANQPFVFWDSVCNMVKRAHKCIPHFGMAFWDVSVREDGVPVIVEVNLRHPNATVAQAAIGGPFCGEYTDRVLSTVAKIRDETDT